MSWPPEKLILPPELIEAIRSENCIAFLGSGLSAGNYDSWPDLVNKLCIHCGSSLQVTRESSTNDLLHAAQDAKNCNQKKYYEHLNIHFGKTATNTNRLYDTVLALPFKCYLTVNFDPQIVIKSSYLIQDPPRLIKAYPALDRGDMPKNSIHYLHGMIVENSNATALDIVLSQDEFAEAYRPNGPIMNMLVPTVENDAIVFIGCQLKEPAMATVFSIAQEHQLRRQKLLASMGNKGDKPPLKFILISKPEEFDQKGAFLPSESEKARASQEDFYLNRGITPVWYVKSGSDHSKLQYVLDKLAKRQPTTPAYGWIKGGPNAP